MSFVHYENNNIKMMSKVMPEPNSGCWLWMGYVAPNGYGKTAARRGGGWTTTYAHREMYKMLVGEIPAGLDLDHKCKVRCCVNPQHLRPVTRAENMKTARSNRDVLLARTRCKNGHEYTAETTKLVTSPLTGLPTRKCMICNKQFFQRRRQSRRISGAI